MDPIMQAHQLKFRPYTMADVEILSRMGGTRKAVHPALKKWFDAQPSASTSTRLIPGIQFTSGINASPNNKTITNQFRPLTMAELQPDIDILRGRNNSGSARKSNNLKSRPTHLNPKCDKSASPNNKTITNQFRPLTMAELQPDIDILRGRNNSGSARKSNNLKSRPTHLNPKCDKSGAKPKIHTNSAPNQKSIMRRSVFRWLQ